MLSKIVLGDGGHVLPMLSFRSVIGLVFVATWLRFGKKPYADARVRYISMAVGVMFTGLIYCLFKAIEAVDVSTAILSYFTYPVLTGLAASALRIEPLSFKGVLCALTAFLGLAIMIGAHPAGLALAGVAYGIGAGCWRVAVLLTTRVYLVGADARLTTWYSMISSTALFLAASLVVRDWNLPHSNLGWAALVVTESRDHGRHPADLHLDGSDRAVPHRAHSQSRAADSDHPRRARARRRHDAAPGCRQRHHARRPGRLPIAALNTTVKALYSAAAAFCN